MSLQLSSAVLVATWWMQLLSPRQLAAWVLQSYQSHTFRWSVKKHRREVVLSQIVEQVEKLKWSVPFPFPQRHPTQTPPATISFDRPSTRSKAMSLTILRPRARQLRKALLTTLADPRDQVCGL